jgi:hypothetical protein
MNKRASFILFRRQKNQYFTSVGSNKEYLRASFNGPTNDTGKGPVPEY